MIWDLPGDLKGSRKVGSEMALPFSFISIVNLHAAKLTSGVEL